MPTLDRKLMLIALARLKSLSEKAKLGRSPIWTFVNSAFFIWIMTTIIIGSAGTVLTRRTECLAEFGGAQQRFVKSFVEFQYRLHGYSDARSKAVETKDLLKANEWEGQNSDFIYSEYRSHTLADVATDLISSYAVLASHSDVATQYEFQETEDGLELWRKGGARMDRPVPLKSVADYSSNGAAVCLKNYDGSESIGQLSDQPSSPPLDSADAALLSQVLCSEGNADPVLKTLYQTFSVVPHANCGVKNIIRSFFESPPTSTHAEVKQLYKYIASEYQKQIQQRLAQSKSFSVFYSSLGEWRSENDHFYFRYREHPDR